MHGPCANSLPMARHLPVAPFSWWPCAATFVLDLRFRSTPAHVRPGWLVLGYGEPHAEAHEQTPEGSLKPHTGPRSGQHAIS